MLLRPQTVLAAHGKPMPRNRIGSKGIQIYAPGGVTWSKKAIIFRNAPYTIENPTDGQIEVRLKFAEVAESAKGCRGPVDGLPCVAAKMAKSVSEGGLYGFEAEDRKPPEQWRSKTHPSFHTAEELRRMLEERKKKRARRGATGMGPRSARYF